MEELTVEKLKALKPGVFASGEIKNEPEGLYMTESDKGRMLAWVAVRGGAYHDWTIYTHWADRGLEFVKSNGDKVTAADNIKKLVPCTEEAFNLYRT